MAAFKRPRKSPLGCDDCVVFENREWIRKLSDRPGFSTSSTVYSSSSRSPLPGLRAYWKPVELVGSAFSRGGRQGNC